MNPSTIRSKILVTALLAGLASVASAQSVAGAVNAATQTTATVAKTPPLPPTLPPSTTSATSAAGAASAASAASAATAGAVVRPPVAPPVTGSAAAAANSAVSGSVTTGVNANASTHASATGQTRGLSVASEASRQASVTVNTADTVSLIRESAFATRNTVTAEVQARVDASAKVVAGLEAKAEQGGEKSRAAMAKALVEVRAREKTLRTSLREAAMATKESSWGEIQSVLAKDYGAYAQAVASAEASAGAAK